MPDLNDKLKLLKVVDLKAILAKANIPPLPKANKADLISKISSSKSALDVYHSLYPSPEAQLLSRNEPRVPPVTETALRELPEAVISPPSPTAPPTPVVITADDTEAEKRRKRAARFGIALVEPPKPQHNRTIRELAPINDVEKLDTRATRLVTKKRAAPTENIDPEEAEKRKRRLERFGGASVGTMV